MKSEVKSSSGFHVPSLRCSNTLTVNPVAIAKSHSITASLCNARSVNNKTAIIADLIQTCDFSCITETWMDENSGPTLEAITPNSYSVLSEGRRDRRGGGVAICGKTTLQLRALNVGPTKSFECIGAQISAGKGIKILVVYRPPGDADSFLQEFPELLAMLTLSYPRWIILGDFNVWAEDPQSQVANELINLMGGLGFTQVVKSVTHRGGHTLDLLFHLGMDISNITVTPVVWSDHHIIQFAIENHPIKQHPKETIKYRPLNKLTPERITANLDFTNLLHSQMDPNNLVTQYNNMIYETLDNIAPWCTKAATKKQKANWFDKTIMDLKKKGRRLERQWRKSGSEEHKSTLVHHLRQYQEAITKKKSDFISHKISTANNRAAQLFHTVEALCNPSCLKPPTTFSRERCEEFSTFFTNKVSAIRASITPTTSTDHWTLYMPTTTRPWQVFDTLSEEDFDVLIQSLRPTTCDLDPGPTGSLMQCPELIRPALHKITQCSLQSGLFPEELKKAIIKPLLKKPTLDPDSVTNYRPVANLPFLSKVIEKAVANQLEARLTDNNIFDTFQSGFRKRHSTETALVRVMNDLLTARDKGECSILILLDLSAAFDTVDHEILIQRLKNYCGLRGAVLSWFQSFLSGRTQQVCLGTHYSNPVPLAYGVPQGSVLSPLLFAVYMLPVGKIVQNYGLGYHCYADDTQLYLSFKPGTQDPSASINACLVELQNWMNTSWLRLNADKTEVLVVGGPHMMDKVQNSPHFNLAKLAIGGDTVQYKDSVRNLGVILDGKLKLRQQVSAVVKSSFFHLRNIVRIKHLIPAEDLPALVHAFVSSHLDYCNALFVGSTDKVLRPLQLVQNAAARLLANIPRSSHISPVLQTLHWLPVKWRIHFKICLLTFKALNHMGPKYIADLLELYAPPRTLRSANKMNLVIPRINLTFGARAFSYAAPTLWNSLPQSVREAPTLDSFKKRLKTHLFSQAFETE